MNPRFPMFVFVPVLVIVPVPYRDPPSSTFPAAPAIDTTGEEVQEPARPLARVIPFATKLKRMA